MVLGVKILFVEINGIKINYEDFGEGKPVVFLHGWGSSIEPFRCLMEPLKSTHRIIAIDFPGFGKSEMIESAWNVSDYVDVTLKFLNHLEIKDAILVGHSFGGRVIFKMVGSGLYSPEKLILIDVAGVVHKKSFKAKVKQCCFKFGKRILTLPVIRKYTEKALNEWRSYFGSADYNAAPSVLRATLVNVVNEDLTEYMPNIKAPSLLIWGENDDATPLSDAKIIEGLIPDSGLCVVKNAGHFCFLNNPAQVNLIIKSFLGVN